MVNCTRLESVSRKASQVRILSPPRRLKIMTNSTILSPKFKKALQISQLLALGIGAGFLLLEGFFYQGFVTRYFGLDPHQVAVATLLYFLIVRITASVTLPAKVFTFLYWRGVPIFSLFAVFLNISPDLFYENFSFHIFHLHPIPLQLVAAYLLTTLIISFQIKPLKKYLQWTYFVTPIILMCNLLFFKWHFVGTIFHRLRREDGLFEYITALSFLAISVLSILIIKKVKKLHLIKNTKVLLFLFFGIVALGAFFVAGEEISWGQRLFNLTTPEKWASINTQEEITLHNHPDILKYVYQAYFLLSFYCAFAWIPAHFISKLVNKHWQAWLKLLVPQWFLAPLFIPTLMYTVGRFTIGWTYYGLGAWEETTEMILSLGLLFFITNSFFHFSEIISPFIDHGQKK